MITKEQNDKLIAAANERMRSLYHVRDACKVCKMCDLGWQKATKQNQGEYDPHVFSNFDPGINLPRFMIVGQNPGWDEVTKGQPFVGLSGGNFEKALEQTYFQRSDFYITNVVKCWTLGNTVPTSEQISRCEPFLRIELAIVKPILVVTFGAVAFNLLCSEYEFKDCVSKIITSDKFGVKVFSTYHPSPRNLMVTERKDTFYKDIRMLGRIMSRYLMPF